MQLCKANIMQQIVETMSIVAAAGGGGGGGGNDPLARACAPYRCC